MQISFSKINPYIRYARYITVTDDYPDQNKVAYDYRLLYVTKGSGSILIGQKSYPLTTESLAVWQPGVAYSIFNETETLEVAMLNFDFLNDPPVDALLPPSSPENFKEQNIHGLVTFTDVPQFNEPLVISAGTAETMIRQICSEYGMRKRFYAEAIQGTLYLLLTTIARSLFFSENTGLNRSNEMIEYIQQRFTRALSSKELSEVFHYHPNHINRIIQQSTGMPLHQYVLSLRLQNAYEMIVHRPDLTTGEISELNGFYDAAHFTKHFKKAFGVTPSEWRKTEKMKMTSLSSAADKGQHKPLSSR